MRGLLIGTEDLKLYSPEGLNTYMCGVDKLNKGLDQNYGMYRNIPLQSPYVCEYMSQNLHFLITCIHYHL